MNDSRTAPEATSAPIQPKRKRKYWSPLAVLFVFAVGAFALQYVVLLAAVILAEAQDHQFSVHVALGPLEFWQAYYRASVSNPEPGHYIGDFRGEAVIREGALLVAVLVGALAAVIQTRRVPAEV